MDAEDGQVFVKNLAHFVRTHEKSLANALQLSHRQPDNERSGVHAREATSAMKPTTSSTLAAALSLGTFHLSSHNINPAKLTLTPHHLYYLLDRFEEIGIQIGPMNVRLENIHTQASPANYVSFLSQSQRSRGRSDHESLHSVSSVRSVVSSMSALWSGFGLHSNNGSVKSEKAKTQMVADLKYLYSAFTKIPCLRLSLDHSARLIGGYEEFPFDTAVPLLAFKNVSALEICDLDFRQFYGWDRLAEQLRSLTVKRAHLVDPTNLLSDIVLDDMDKRRRRSSKTQSSPILAWPTSPSLRFNDASKTKSTPSSPMPDDKFGHSVSPRRSLAFPPEIESPVRRQKLRTKSASPSRPSSPRQEASSRPVHATPRKVQRSGSGSSISSTHSNGPFRNGSSSNLLLNGILPASKWRFLKHLSLADNSLTSLTSASLAPVSETLHSLDLSSNLFVETPDCLSDMTALRALDLSNCMIDSLHSIARNPLPAIKSLNLRCNRLASIAGIERILSLQRLDLRDNKLLDPIELARLTCILDIREIWVLRNPFVKTHSNYRVTIFNLFRDTPGYHHDVVIDSSSPGYSERRQLKDWAVEPEGGTTSQPVPYEPSNVLPTPNTTTLRRTEDDNHEDVRRPPAPQTTQSEFAIGSNRRKRGPRRRIVDLAREEGTSMGYPQQSPSAIPQDAIQSGPVGQIPAQPALPVLPSNLRDSLPPLEPPMVKKSSPSTLPDISDRGRSLATELTSLNLNGEAYRQKIEALKSEVGNNWLSVLSEEGLNIRQKSLAPSPPFNNVGMTRSEMPRIRPAAGLVGGSRTLG